MAEQFEGLPPGFCCFVRLPDGLRPGDVAFFRRPGARRVVLLVDRIDPSFAALPQWTQQAGDTWYDPRSGVCVVRWGIDEFDLRRLRSRAESLDARVGALVIGGPGADPGQIAELRMLLELTGRA